MTIKTKGLMIILDGLGDRGCTDFNGRTPLEAADTPNLDTLASRGQSGLVDPFFPGMPVGTHLGSGVLMGLPVPEAALLARGPVEAAGLDLALEAEDVVFRCNFATVEPDGNGTTRLLDRRAGRIKEGTAELAKVLRDLDLGDGITGNLYPATQHRAVLHLKGDGMGPDVCDVDPGSGRENLGILRCEPLNVDDEAASKTAISVNRFVDLSIERLHDHPINQQRSRAGLLAANAVICRSAGQSRRYPNIVKRLGVNVAVVSAEATVQGLGRLFGFTNYTDPRFTACPDTDIDAKIDMSLRVLEDHDLVFLHVKGPDICSHDRDPIGKRYLLSRIDNALAPLLERDLVIGITGDHSTDSNRGRHCGDPVPSLLVAPNGRRDKETLFGESTCASGGLGRLTATSYLTSLLDLMGALKNFQPQDRAYFSSLCS